MRKILVALVIMALSATSVYAGVYSNLEETLGGTVYFPDVGADHPNHLSIAWMADEGYVDGYPDGTFKPNGLVNRAELMKMVVGDEVDLTGYGNCFPDVLTDWYAPYVCYAYELGWINGYPDGTFKPANNVNRVEAMKIILNAGLPGERWPTPTEAEMNLAYPADIIDGEWYEPFAKFAIAKELVDGQHVIQNADGTLSYFPEGPMSRKEVSEMLFRLVVYEVERLNYATIMAEATCYVVDNPDLGPLEGEAGVIAIWESYGYTEDEANALALLLESDDVVQADINSKMQELCPL